MRTPAAKAENLRNLLRMQHEHSLAVVAQNRAARQQAVLLAARYPMKKLAEAPSFTLAFRPRRKAESFVGSLHPKRSRLRTSRADGYDDARRTAVNI